MNVRQHSAGGASKEARSNDGAAGINVEMVSAVSPRFAAESVSKSVDTIHKEDAHNCEAHSGVHHEKACHPKTAKHTQTPPSST